jgi:YD repeat-containing protein
MPTPTYYKSKQLVFAHMSSHFKLLRLSRAVFTSVTICGLLFTIMGSARGQNAIHGSTPASQAPGAPSGSYALSGFENVNLYNGHLNFHLPLLSVNGRGESGDTITLPIESRWVSEGTIGGGGFTSNLNWWTGIKPGYNPGVLQGRQIGEPCDWESPGTTTSTATRLTFTSNDGTEYELLDTQFGGDAALSNCTSLNPPNPGASRGNTFVSVDGTSATFVSDSAIVDNPRAGDGALLIYPTGNLFFANGTRYRIVNGLVTQIRDRNGNVTSFEYDSPNFSGRVVSIRDSLDRQVNVSYASGSITFDQITFKGFDGADRSIKIERTNLENVGRQLPA